MSETEILIQALRIQSETKSRSFYPSSVQEQSAPTVGDSEYPFAGQRAAKNRPENR